MKGEERIGIFKLQTERGKHTLHTRIVLDPPEESGVEAGPQKLHTRREPGRRR